MIDRGSQCHYPNTMHLEKEQSRVGRGHTGSWGVNEEWCTKMGLNRDMETRLPVPRKGR